MARLVANTIGDAGTVDYTGAGTGPGLDFKISYQDGRSGVGEIVWHEDSELQEMKQVLARLEYDGPIALPPGLGCWIVHLVRGARIKDLPARVTEFILRLEALGISDVSVIARDIPPRLRAEMVNLGLNGLRCFRGMKPSAAYLMVPDVTAGIVAGAESIVEWVEAVLNHDDYRDVARKLLAIEVDERHAFVVAGSRTPLGPYLRLANGNDMCPERDPHLPRGITDVWCTSTFGVAPALHWSREGGWREAPRESTR